MGKQVVYEIRFSNRTEYGDLIAKKQKQLKEYEKAKIDTTDLSLEIAELYVERCDDLDNKLSQDDIERDLNEYLQNAIRICNNVYLKKGQDDMILARIYELLIQCYKKLEYHESAIKGCTELLSILKRQYPRDLSRLQKAYKTLGDLYFTNGHDPEEALFSDFQNAWENYSLEREILDSKVLKDGYDDINLRLTLSSNINMGVMLGKIPNPKFKAETFFVAATKIAKQLNDHEAEKECWREFGNFFQHYRHWDNALMCQRKEIKLARMLGSKEDELSCRIDNVKVYLEIEKFDECKKSFKRIKELTLDLETEDLYSEITSLVWDIESINKEIAQVSLECPLDRAKLYLELGEIFFEVGMKRAATKSAAEGLLNIGPDFKHPDDLSWMVQINLMHLEAASNENSSTQIYESQLIINQKILGVLKSGIKNRRLYLENCIKVYKRMARISSYYGKESASERWKMIAKTAKDQYDELEESLTEEYESAHELGTVEPLELIDPLQMALRVYMNINDQPIVIDLACQKEYASVKWITKQLINKTWRIYGEKISVDYFIINGAQVRSPETKIKIIKGTKHKIKACVKAHAKGLDEYYENVCSRLKIPIIVRLKYALKNQADNRLVLSGLALSSEDVPILRFILSRTGPLDHVDLSANLFDDDAIIKLFEDMSCPRHIDLRSNLLTGKCFRYICQIGQGRLSSLRLAYNNFESTSTDIASDLAAVCTSLEVLDLEER